MSIPGYSTTQAKPYWQTNPPRPEKIPSVPPYYRVQPQPAPAIQETPAEVGKPPWRQFIHNFTKLPVTLTPVEAFALIAKHPQQFYQLKKTDGATLFSSDTSILNTLKMYSSVYSALDREGRNQLKELWSQGVLQKTDTEDGKSGLYHLYSMLSSPRAPGYSPKILVREAVDIIARPYDITQTVRPLSPTGTVETLKAANGTSLLDSSQNKPIQQTLSPEELNIQYSATCVASSVMFYMADKEPVELLRQLNELSSLMEGFTEKVNARELLPDQPEAAATLLREKNVPFVQTGKDEFKLLVKTPNTARTRAVDSQRENPHKRKYRSALETAYQATLTRLANPGYNAATDLMSDGSGGLTEDEKTEMESIIKDNGGTQSVTYQSVIAGSPDAPDSTYLSGYNRSFENITQDIIQALKMGEPVIIGITETQHDGKIVNGHEITVTGAQVNKRNGEIEFIVADSDDGKPGAVYYSARKLVPQIHHIGLPLKLGKQVNHDIESALDKNTEVLVPDASDYTNFEPIHIMPTTGSTPDSPTSKPVMVTSK